MFAFRPYPTLAHRVNPDKQLQKSVLSVCPTNPVAFNEKRRSAVPKPKLIRNHRLKQRYLQNPTAENALLLSVEKWDAMLNIVNNAENDTALFVTLSH